MTWLEIGGWVAATVAIGAGARWLRLNESRLTDPERACTLAEGALAGFVARQAIVSGDGGAALVAGNGTVAVLRRRGVRVLTGRLLPPLRLGVAVEGVTVETGTLMFGSVVLTGVIADEVRALEGLAERPTVH